MSLYLAVDGGTTNTRVLLTDGRNCLGKRCEEIGAGSEDAMRQTLPSWLHDAFSALLAEQNLSFSDLTAILAAGMITSENGLHCLPHLSLPADVHALHDGMRAVCFPQIAPLPIYFIPGLRTRGDTPLTTDMMRGEECEFYGLCEEEKFLPYTMVVLPGSHSKLILTDADGRISDFTTLLTGEMLAALAHHTILRDAVDFGVQTVDKTALCEGHFAQKALGLHETLFKVRVLKNLYGADAQSVYSFFLGAVLSGEICRILSMPCREILLGGRKELREAMYILLSNELAKSDVCVRCLPEETVQNANFRGMVRIFEATKNNEKQRTRDSRI